MNDGKFKIAVLDSESNIELPIPLSAKLALVKISNNDPIPDDEPVFIFRARDTYALSVLHFYLDQSRKWGCNDYHKDGMMAAIKRFKDWRTENPEKIKQPGITRGV
jgi:hypothetical protein